MEYESFILPNGLRVVHKSSDSQVAYCGFAINTGTRDELPEEYGMAHFIEHLLFKGTQKRKAHHILNRMELVGGELNAYTTKEETFIYSVFLKEDFERALELLTDLVFKSGFPENEIDKERDVILDEINSYRDNPSELIFDEFENLIFSGHEIGHNILGEEDTLASFDRKMCNDFYHRFYTLENVVFFSTGNIPFTRVFRLVEKYCKDINLHQQSNISRKAPQESVSRQVSLEKNSYQAHVMIGTKAYSMPDEKRFGLYLLNNILGGLGMNSRLNIILREKYGLVYNVESSLTSYTDTGIFSIYFGCEKKNKSRCIDLIFKELNLFCNQALNGSRLLAAKKQLKGQMGVSSDNRENVCLSMGKSILHYNKFNSLQTIYNKIDSLDSLQLLEISNEIFAKDNLSMLIYE